MRKVNFEKLLILSVIIGISLFSSCRKDDIEIVVPSTNTENNNSEIDEGAIKLG